jgi:hypothetical protein
MNKSDKVDHQSRSPRVVWGNDADPERKARVLAALMRRPAAVYDVSAPDAPTTRAATAPLPSACSVDRVATGPYCPVVASE